ncbi:hypothetical protein D9613_010225 [Agrocybe pediades]|uniref:Uncharacterized protein n=1 Tax=Agrocybe pediades TaxID=84607 RepID=A0A8H4VJ76_9AGAR|nr:hypothetical protein D9613_010225 [Agrocybe pediades]
MFLQASSSYKRSLPRSRLKTNIVFPTMSTAGDVFSVAQQKSRISIDLNSTLLYQFLFGIYTGLFPATMYIYMRKENRTRAKDMIIIGSTTALYVITALNTVMNWLYTNILFGAQNGTRVEMFIESLTGDMPLGEEIIDDLAVFVGFFFADGLLVWRCFYACGRSFRISLLPITLLIVEAASPALTITALVYNCLLNAKPGFETDQTNKISSFLSAALLVTVAATSSVSTVLICLRIWQPTALSSHSRKRYQAITNILISSSAILTVFVLFSAILSFVNTGNLENSYTVFVISEFVDSVTQIISGLAPTLMIARLFMSSSQENTETSSVHLPSELISRASHITGTNTTNVGDDLEMQQSRSIWADDGESEEIQAVPKNECRGQPEDVLEDELKTIV